MTRFSVSTSNQQTIHGALELSKNSWLLAIQVPGRDNPSLHPIKGGDAEGLMAKLGAARRRVAKVTGQTPTVTLCYEAGYDGILVGAPPRATGYRMSGHGAGQPAGQPQGAAGEDRSHRCREHPSYADRLVPRRASCLLHGGDTERRRGGSSPLSSGGAPWKGAVS